MAFVVVYDACVLYPAHVRDLLIRLATTGLFQAKWTEQILDECFRSIAKARPDLDPERLARTRQKMTAAIPDCLVIGYETLVDGLTLPDPDDRHVVAAAIRAGAQVIVTVNLKDFPASELERFGVEAQTPDEFVSQLVSLSPEAVLGVVTDAASALKKPPMTVDKLLDTLGAAGLHNTVSLLRALNS